MAALPPKDKAVEVHSSISDNQPSDDSLFYGPKLPPLVPEKDPFAKMKELRVKHSKDSIISYLNIDSIRNKFENFTV